MNFICQIEGYKKECFSSHSLANHIRFTHKITKEKYAGESKKIDFLFNELNFYFKKNNLRKIRR